MNNKQIIVLLIVLLATFMLACQSVNGFDVELPEFLQGESAEVNTQEWPKVRVGSIRRIENIVGFEIPVETISNALQYDITILPPLSLEPVVTFSTTPPQPVAAQLFAKEVLPPIPAENIEEQILPNLFLGTLTGHVPQITIQQAHQINIRSSRRQLETIRITVNGQPLVDGEGPIFPSHLLEVGLCTDVNWLRDTGTGPSLRCTKIGDGDTFLPREPMPTLEEPVTLVVTGKVPGTYNIGLSATDSKDRVREITQKIEVIKPTE